MESQKNDAMVSIAAPSLKLLEKMEGATVALKSFGILYNLSIVAAHRAPKKTYNSHQSLNVPK